MDRNKELVDLNDAMQELHLALQVSRLQDFKDCEHSRLRVIVQNYLYLGKTYT